MTSVESPECVCLGPGLLLRHLPPAAHLHQVQLGAHQDHRGRHHACTLPGTGHMQLLQSYNQCFRCCITSPPGPRCPPCPSWGGTAGRRPPPRPRCCGSRTGTGTCHHRGIITGDRGQRTGDRGAAAGHLKRSWPAVSHRCSLTLAPPTRTLRDTKSTPTVASSPPRKLAWVRHLCSVRGRKAKS